MASGPVKSRKNSPSEWERFKPHIQKLYLKEKKNAKLVMKEMKKQGFTASIADYRTQFLKWGPAWKKNNRSEDRDKIETILVQRSRAGQKLVMYRQGERVPDEEVAQIINRSRVSTLMLHDPQCPQPPQGIRIEEKREDLTGELLKGLPYLELERKVYDWIRTECNGLFSGNAGPVELRALLIIRRAQESGQPDLVVPRPADNLSTEPLASIESSLSSIIPYLPPDQMLHFGASLLDTWEKVRIPEVHRQILCALSNNLAGLPGISRRQLFELLKAVISWDVLRLFLFLGGPLRQPMASQLLKCFVEVGNTELADAVLSVSPCLDIDVNKEVCEVEGQHYTLLERASMLRHSGMIEVLLKRGADVHKRFPCIHLEGDIVPCNHCHARGALHCALDLGPEGKRLDPRIFNQLLNQSVTIHWVTIQLLLRCKKFKLLFEVLRRFARTNHKDWQIQRKPVDIWCEMMRELGKEKLAMKLLPMMDKLGTAKCTNLLNMAARNGHGAIVEKLIEEGITINKSSLCSAVKGKNEGLVRRMLEKFGASVNDNNYDVPQFAFFEEDPYSTAIRTGNERIVQILEEHKALERLDQKAPWIAAWKAAVTVGNIDIIKSLLAKRKDVSTHHLGCALSMVVSLEDFDMTVYLLNRGAELEVTSGQIWYPARPALIAALEAENPDLVSLLLDSGANPNSPVSGHLAPIYLAVKWGNDLVVERLLAAGARTGTKRAFLLAVENGDYFMMEKLLHTGVSIKGALEVATKCGNLDTCRWLLSHGADPQESQVLCNAYHRQLQGDSLLLANLLQACKKRCPLGIGNAGSAVLWDALKSDDEHTVKLLLEHGANPNGFLSVDRQQDQNITPLFFAIAAAAKGKTFWLDLFLNHDYKSKAFECTPQTVVSEMKDFDDGRPGPMITALLAAVGTRSMTVVRLVSQRKNAEINFPANGRIKRTPLQRAAEIGHLEIVKFLYGSGADVNAPPSRTGGATALQLAAQGGFTAIVVYLLNQGAKVNAPKALINGSTAIESAAAHGRLDTLHILLQEHTRQGGGDWVQFQRAIDFAEKSSHPVAVKMLQAHLRLTGQYSFVLQHASSRDPAAQLKAIFESHRDFADPHQLIDPSLQVQGRRRL